MNHWFYPPHPDISSTRKATFGDRLSALSFDELTFRQTESVLLRNQQQQSGWHSKLPFDLYHGSGLVLRADGEYTSSFPQNTIFPQVVVLLGWTAEAAGYPLHLYVTCSISAPPAKLTDHRSRMANRKHTAIIIRSPRKQQGRMNLVNQRLKLQ